MLDRADHAGRKAAHRRHAAARAGAEVDFEAAYGATTHNIYGMCAMRHMHDYGTTSEQLAWIKVAASHHAQYNPHAMLKEVVTVEDVLNSPMISDPLHRMDCLRCYRRWRCADRDHAGNRQEPQKPLVRMIGHGEAMKGPRGGKDLISLTPPASGQVPGVRRSRRHAKGYQIRLDLRQLHHHGADADRRPRLLQEGRGGKFVATAI